VRFLGWTSVSTKIRDCHFPNSTTLSIRVHVLSGGKSSGLKWECALSWWAYGLSRGISVSRKTLMSSSKPYSFSVSTSEPVARGAKTFTRPLCMSYPETMSRTLSVKSTNSISPFVEKLMAWLKTLKSAKMLTPVA
jgi:hypothetical protein